MAFDDAVVDLTRIDAEDNAFRITTNTGNAALAKSILGVGLIAPPLLLSRSKDGGDAGFRIVAGFRRVAACKALGRRRISARVLPPETPGLTCARLAAADNALQRSLNPIEISRALTLLSRHLSDSADLAATAGDLGLPDAPDPIRKLLPLCTLPAELQSGILSGAISLSMARTLSVLDSDLAVALVRLFSDLRLSLNKQREVLTLLQEIALREERTAADVLNDAAVQSILGDPEADRNQRAAALRRWLRRRRRPAVSRAEAAFTEAVRELPLGEGVRLIPPKDFESPVYTLSLAFKSRSELSDRNRRIGEILSHPALGTILS